MPNIRVDIPRGAFPGEARAELVRRINEAAATAEQIPADAKHRFFCWVQVNETEPGAWTCGGVDMTSTLLPCTAVAQVPAGVLDEAARSGFVQLMHDAFRLSLPSGEKRRLATSVVLHDVADGTWGVNGAIWKLPDFARAAGFEHLRQLVS